MEIDTFLLPLFELDLLLQSFMMQIQLFIMNEMILYILNYRHLFIIGRGVDFRIAQEKGSSQNKGIILSTR